MNRLMQAVVQALRPGSALSVDGLVVIPLVGTKAVKARYVLLEEALQRGRLTISEVDEGGQVPYLRAVNQGPRPVLIHDGEELVGAKQNRIANVTVLVGVGERIIPVSCVEAGRWQYASGSFKSAGRASHPTMRRMKERQVRENLTRDEGRAPGAAFLPDPPAAPSASRRGGSRPRSERTQEERVRRFRSDQGAVWDEVAEVSNALSVHSATSALNDAYLAREQEIEGRLLALTGEGDSPLPAGTVGVAVFLDDRFICLDALWPSERFVGLYPKLARGYLFEKLVDRRRKAAGTQGMPVDPEAYVLRLLARLPDMELYDQPSADLGRDVRLSGQGHLGSGLSWQDRLIQLSLFAA
jgi:hypothetical protein